MTGSLIPAYRALHARGKFPGLSIRPFLIEITELVMSSGVKTLLDYGCGAGQQYNEEKWHLFWGFKPTLYDPAVKAFCQRPNGRFGGVICTDVLEHVPIEELPEVIDDLVFYSKRWCFVSVCCRPSVNKFLPDGRNVHVTLRPEKWWQDKLGQAFDNQANLYLRFTP